MEQIRALRQWRIDNGLSLQAAADKLDLPKPTLHRYETGERQPRLTRAAQLSKITGIPIDQFVKQPEAAQ